MRLSGPSNVGYVKVTAVRSRKGTSERLKTVRTCTLALDGDESSHAASVFVISGAVQPREWLGFGGSFTEAAADTFRRMSRPKQSQILRAYFDRSGLGYSLGRIPIGSCDFSLGHWTCGDLSDGSLKGFSLERYEAAILPMVRSAIQLAGPMSILASPWTPPTWMKSNGKFNGGGKLLPQYKGLWAQHYVLFAQEMSSRGVPLWGISVQNEPGAATPWESCQWTAMEEAEFIRDFLGPAVENAKLELKIVAWDHNRDEMLQRAACFYGDPDTAKYVWGIGYHWYGDPRFEWWPGRAEVKFEDALRVLAADKKLPAAVMDFLAGSKHAEGPMHFPELRGRLCLDSVRQTAELRPDKHLLFTEGCQELGGRSLDSMLDSWKTGERYGMNIIADLNAGCEGWIDWNLCLDELGGPNHTGNYCLAPVICDTRTDEVLLQPAYWFLGHFSRYIRPGARRVLCSSSRDLLECTAWRNVDSSLSVVVMNQSESDIQFTLKISGFGAMKTEAPSHSITTYIDTRLCWLAASFFAKGEECSADEDSTFKHFLAQILFDVLIPASFTTQVLFNDRARGFLGSWDARLADGQDDGRGSGPSLRGFPTGQLWQGEGVLAGVKVDLGFELQWRSVVTTRAMQLERVRRVLGVVVAIALLISMLVLSLMLLVFNLPRRLLQVLLQAVASCFGYVVEHAYTLRICKLHVNLSRMLQRKFARRPYHSRFIDIRTRLYPTGGGVCYVHAVPCLSDNFCYVIVYDEGSRAEGAQNSRPGLPAAVVDPCDAAAVEEALEHIAEDFYASFGGLRLEAVLCTHKHWDHSGGNEELVARASSAKQEAAALQDSATESESQDVTAVQLLHFAQTLRVFGGLEDDVPGCTHPVQHLDEIQISNLSFQAIAAPGHTQGSVMFRLPCKAESSGDLVDGERLDAFFTGDTLFSGGCGANFEGSELDMEHCFASILEMCDPSHKTWLFPGHEYTQQLLDQGISQGIVAQELPLNISHKALMFHENLAPACGNEAAADQGGHGLLVAAASPPLAVLYRADLDALRQELLSGLTGPEAAERLRQLEKRPFEADILTDEGDCFSDSGLLPAEEEAIQREAASGQQDPVSEEQAEKPVWNEVPVKDALKALAVPAHLAVGPKVPCKEEDLPISFCRLKAVCDHLQVPLRSSSALLSVLQQPRDNPSSEEEHPNHCCLEVLCCCPSARSIVARNVGDESPEADSDRLIPLRVAISCLTPRDVKRTKAEGFFQRLRRCLPCQGCCVGDDSAQPKDASASTSHKAAMASERSQQLPSVVFALNAMRFLAAFTLTLSLTVIALDQDGRGRPHRVALEAAEESESEVSGKPGRSHVSKARHPVRRGTRKQTTKATKPLKETHAAKDGHGSAKAKLARKAATEVSSQGRLSQHQAHSSHWSSRPHHANSLMEVKVPQVMDDFPVTFFQEESEQGPFHPARERLHEREGSGMEVEVAKLSDAPDESEDYGQEDEEAPTEDQADDFTLPKASDELEGHQDAAAVADVLSSSPASIMRREAHDTGSKELPAEVAAKRWLGLYGDFKHSKVSGQRQLRKVVLVFVFMGIAGLFMLLALTKADKIIRSVLSHVSLSTEPTGSELQEPVDKKGSEQANGAPEAAKALANLLESSLGPCAASRKLSKEDKEFDSDTGSSGALRSRIEALPVSAAAQVERLLPSAGGYDVTFSKPLSSRQLLRLEATIQCPGEAEPLLAPLTQRPCVLYTANASRKVHGGMPLPVAFASQHTDFVVTLRGTPRVDIRVAGSEVNLFATKECEFAEVLPFPCAPDHWQDFVSAHLSSAGTGSSDNHAMENGLRAKGTAVEFHECCLVTGATVTLIGELMRSASGELTLQPLSQEQVSWKRPSWERPGLGAETDDPLELLEARTHVLISDDPTLLTVLPTDQVNQRTGMRVRSLEALCAGGPQEVVVLWNDPISLQVAKRNVDGLPELPLAKWEDITFETDGAGSKGSELLGKARALPCLRDLVISPEPAVKVVVSSILLKRINSKVDFAVEVLFRALELLWLYAPLVPLLAVALVADRIPLGSADARPSRQDPPSWVDWWWALALRKVQRSGPVFVKLGQWAATRPDLIPEDICSRLGHLHDSTEPHSLKHTHKVLSESFSGTWFRQILIEPEPIGSGCIAQVYRGRLLTGGAASSKASPLLALGVRLQRFCGGACSSPGPMCMEVAVKVVHPQVQRAVEVDLQVLDRLAGFSSYLGMDRLGMPLMLRQFSSFLKAQTDLRTEAQNLRRLKQLLGPNDSSVVIPEVFDGWVSRNVLVMSFEEGEPLSSLLDASDSSLERARLEAWRILVDSFWAMVFKYRFVHGDLHPGNIFWRRHVDRAGKVQLVLLDCGLVIDLSGEAGEDLSAMLKAFLTKSEEEVARLLITLSERVGGKPEDVVEPEGFVQGIADLIRAGKGVGFRLSKLNAGSLMGQSLLLGRKHGVRFDARFVNLMVAMVVVQGVSLRLNGDGDIMSRMCPFLFGAAVSHVTG
ncbi:GBA [Symbiodinium pilosum]|uniref:GBA protein n=1 Tax=Symbiodinium pilosum TaxID=2952 RepID=A0A812N1F0_SYMPI|nr:GBA [Symbiodinium pilosum]